MGNGKASGNWYDSLLEPIFVIIWLDQQKISVFDYFSEKKRKQEEGGKLMMKREKTWHEGKGKKWQEGEEIE